MLALLDSDIFYLYLRKINRCNPNNISLKVLSQFKFNINNASRQQCTIALTEYRTVRLQI